MHGMKRYSFYLDPAFVVYQFNTRTRSIHFIDDADERKITFIGVLYPFMRTEDSINSFHVIHLLQKESDIGLWFDVSIKISVHLPFVFCSSVVISMIGLVCC
eukprot:171198_1